MANFIISHQHVEIPESITTVVLQNSLSLLYHQSLPVYRPTPLVSLPWLEKFSGVGRILIKDESHRFGLNAFKGLGASYAIHTLLQRNSNINAFCTATDGNHGRAVAWAARQAGRKAYVFVPEITTQQRINAIQNEGATVVKVSGDYDLTCRSAEEQSTRNGWTLLQDTAWEGYEEIPALIMAGYLTMYQEAQEQMEDQMVRNPDVIFLQAGVGSWAASALWYYGFGKTGTRPKMVIVEPEESNGIFTSVSTGMRTLPTGSGKTMMAGLNCGIPSLTAWPFIQSLADAVITISESEVAQAMKMLYHSEPSIVSGESGAAGIAGFMAVSTLPEMEPLRRFLDLNKDSTVLLFSTEGATDQLNFDKVVTNFR